MSERLIPTTKALCLSAALLLASPASGAEWESLPPLPEPNGGFICGAQGSRVVIVGGTNWEGGTKNWLRAIHEYDPAKRKWEKVKDLQAGPVAYGVALHPKTSDGIARLAFIGGSNGKGAVKALAVVDGIKTSLQPVDGLPSSIASA